jgi:hypothetical protein
MNFTHSSFKRGILGGYIGLSSPTVVRPLKWLKDMRFIAKKECEFGNATSFHS